MYSESFRRGALWRVAAVVGVGIFGLASIVGSGGGGVGFPPCDAPYCNSPPEALTVHIDPPSTTAMVGAAVTFRAVDVNYGNVTYQWRRSDDAGQSYADIAGATGDSLSLPSVNLSDDGAWFMVAARAGETLQAQAVARLAVSAAAPVVYRDSEFDLASWITMTRLPNAADPSFKANIERLPAGGNPDAFLQTSFMVPSNTGIVVVLYLSETAVYNPGMQGAIVSIDYAEDCTALVRGTATATLPQMLIEQGGRLFASPMPALACVSTAWKPVGNRAGLRSTDFSLIEGPACAAGQVCPDFSVSAAPLRFGFQRRTSSYLNEAAAHGIDNWQVTVWRR